MGRRKKQGKGTGGKKQEKVRNRRKEKRKGKGKKKKKRKGKRKKERKEKEKKKRKRTLEGCGQQQASYVAPPEGATTLQRIQILSTPTTLNGGYLNDLDAAAEPTGGGRENFKNLVFFNKIC